MKISPTDLFNNYLRTEINYYSSTPIIKAWAGGSIKNHRVPSVNQVIRYLALQNDNEVLLGTALSIVYSELLVKGLMKKVRNKNNRTDAYDINEFLTAVDKFVKKDPNLKGLISKKIGPTIKQVYGKVYIANNV